MQYEQASGVFVVQERGLSKEVDDEIRHFPLTAVARHAPVLLGTENVSHQGNYWNLAETTILPRPITRPHPQFWRATSSVPTMVWSLARGLKVITGGTASSMERVMHNWHLFQDAVEATNVAWPQEFIIQRGVYVSDTEEDAKTMLPHAVWHTRTARGLSSNTLPVNAGAGDS